MNKIDILNIVPTEGAELLLTKKANISFLPLCRSCGGEMVKVWRETTCGYQAVWVCSGETTGCQ